MRTAYTLGTRAALWRHVPEVYSNQGNSHFHQEEQILRVPLRVNPCLINVRQLTELQLQILVENQLSVAFRQEFGVIFFLSHAKGWYQQQYK